MDNILGNEVIKNLILAIATEALLVIFIAPLREAIGRHKVLAAIISVTIIYYFAFNFSIPSTSPNDVETVGNNKGTIDIYQATKDAQAKAEAETKERATAEKAATEAQAKADAEAQKRAVAEQVAIDAQAKAEAEAKKRAAAEQTATDAQAKADEETQKRVAAEQAAIDAQAKADEETQKRAAAEQTATDAQAKADAEVQEQNIEDAIYDSTCIKFDIPSIIYLNQSEPEENIYEIAWENTGNVELDFNSDACLVIEIDDTNYIYKQWFSEDGSHRVSPSDTSDFIIDFNKENFRPAGDVGFYSFYIARKDPSNYRFNENTAIPFGERKNIRIEFVD